MESEFNKTVEQMTEQFTNMETEMGSIIALADRYTLSLISNVTSMNTTVDKLRSRHNIHADSTRANFKVNFVKLIKYI